MSLKAFHVVFVLASTLLCVGLGVFFGSEYLNTHATGTLLLASASLLGVVVLVVYGVWFLKKLKGVSYL